MSGEIKFAPREVFEQMLEWGVMPTFDLVIQQGNEGVIIVKRKIAPYQNQWALPGLRQYKGEKFRDTLGRIAKNELGLEIDPTEAKFLGQCDGFFTTEHNRQDISTGYLIVLDDEQKIDINPEHFSSMRTIESEREIPKGTGAMYRFYLKKYFELKN